MHVRTFCLAMVLVASTYGRSLHGSDVIWDGDVSSDWQTGANWHALCTDGPFCVQRAPGPGDHAVLADTQPLGSDLATLRPNTGEPVLGPELGADQVDGALGIHGDEGAQRRDVGLVRLDRAHHVAEERAVGGRAEHARRQRAGDLVQHALHRGARHRRRLGHLAGQ